MQYIKQLLGTEWLKLKNYLAFKLIAIFFGIGVVAANYIVYSFNENVVSNVQGAGLLGSFSLYSFYNTWQTTSYTSGWLLMLPAMLLLILITNEFTYRTSRQNIIDGWSREDAFNIKILLVLIFAIVSTILVILTALTFGLFSGTSFSLNGFSHVGFFFIKALTYNLIATFIAFWIRRTGFAIGVFFIYLGAENIISQLLDVWSIQLLTTEGVDLGTIGDYLPMNASDGLLTIPPNPLKDLSQSIMPTYNVYIVLAFAIVYLILFFWLTKRSVLKRDL
jgi:hypothetical protein